MESYSERPEDFWKGVVQNDPDDCWPWKGRPAVNGYGRAGAEYAHRLAFLFTHGPLPEGHEVRHSCDNRICCNPAHLLSGSRAENVHDMLERGRHYSPFTREERERFGAPAGGAFVPNRGDKAEFEELQQKLGLMKDDGGPAKIEGQEELFG